MIIPVLKFCHRSTLVAIEILAAIFFVLLGLMCIVFWKLSQGPVDVTFAADAVKRAIVSSDHTTDFKFDGIVAEWPEFSGPIIIGLSGVKLNREWKACSEYSAAGNPHCQNAFAGWLYQA